MIFRIPASALLPTVLLVLCATPLAFAVPGLQVLYLVPLTLGYWVLRTRTVADADELCTRTAFGGKHIAWSDVVSLRVTERGWVRVALTGERELALPAVRARHLSLLAAVSGGRLSDPATTAEKPAGEPEPVTAQEQGAAQPIAATDS